MAVNENNAIVSLEDAKLYMGITVSTSDRLIDMMVSQACELISKVVGYNVISQSYREYHSGTGGLNLWLDNIPVTIVDLAAENRNTVGSVQYTNGDSSRATVEVTDVHLRLRKRVSGTTTSNELVLSDYATISTLETAVELLSGWSMTVTSAFSTYTPAELVIRPALSAKDRWVELDIPEEGETSYEIVDADNGRLYNPYGWSWGHNNLLVEYTAGYTREDVPTPIRSACLIMAKSLYDASQRDTGLKKENIGDYGYERFDPTSETGSIAASLPDSVMTMLQPYIRQTIRGV